MRASSVALVVPWLPVAQPAAATNSPAAAFTVTVTDRDGDHVLYTGAGDGGDTETSANWTFDGSASLEDTLPGLRRFEVHLTYSGHTPMDMAARVTWTLAGGHPLDWMTPGFFYGGGAPAGYRGHPYPCLGQAGGDPDLLVANAWGFRVDRASHPVVFAWTQTDCFGLASDPSFGDDMIGLEFGESGTVAWLGLRFPYAEYPRSYTYGPHGWSSPPYAAMRTVRPGEHVRFSFWLYSTDSDPHAFDPLVRWLYARNSETSQRLPRLTSGDAAALAANGISRWHANPEERVLYETVWFDDDPSRPRVDRRQEHVGWISGVPTAVALARYGCATDDAMLAAIGFDVIDRIASEALTPTGLFWSDWVEGRGWGTGWSPQPDWIQARTSAEAVLFLIRAVAEEAARGQARPGWMAAARRNLDFALRAQRDDGNFGAYYQASDGEVVDWSGSAGLLWVAALAEGSQIMNDHRYLNAARRGGSYYAQQVERGTLFGAPEDADLTPSSEDGYNALLSYMALYRHDPVDRPRWLRLARLAADWMLTFRCAFNVSFAPNTLLGQLNFATRGGDIASPRNNHLHVYGLICLRDLLQLWEATHDAYYLERARDALLFSWQTIARFDGEFGAGRGMLTEQWYQTDWLGSKGDMLRLSHVWSLGMVLHGWWAARQCPELNVM